MTCLKRSQRGFTLFELVVIIIVAGMLAAAAFNAPKIDPGTGNTKDLDVIRTALRQLLIRTMADLPSANWYATGTKAEVALFNNGTRVIGYPLTGSTGSFSASFNSLGQLQTNASIPSEIYIEPETGYIP